MVKKFARPGANSSTVRLELTPLIDTVFNLLIFFAVSTTLISSRAGLPVDLPQAKTAETQKSKVMVSVDRDGRIFYEESPVTAEELEVRLKQAFAQQPQVLVIVNADRRVVYDRVVQVLDVARSAGIRNLALAVKKEKAAQESPTKTP